MPKRTATKPATKNRFKNSYAIPKPRRHEELDAALVGIPDEWIREEMAFWSWPDSPEGALWCDMSATLEIFLKDVGLDARERKFLWPGAERLDLDKSIRRINQQYPEFQEHNIKEFMIFWIRALYLPEGCSESQMDELEKLTERWAEDVNPGKN
jgi:hypothetical protein